MLQIEIQNEENYFLPEDGQAARERFLWFIRMPSDTWIDGYNFSDLEMMDAIKENDAKGIVYDCLLDYLQAQGPSEKSLLTEFNATKKVSVLTLTTAGLNSKRTSQIWHSKAGVKKALDGGPPYCLEGSTNFSKGSWDQGNTMRVFRSQEWADAFIKRHTEHKEWAIKNKPQYQTTISNIQASSMNIMEPDEEAILIVQSEIVKWQKVLDGLLYK